jgi:hypothetical protein
MFSNEDTLPVDINIQVAYSHFICKWLNKHPIIRTQFVYTLLLLQQIEQQLYVSNAESSHHQFVHSCSHITCNPKIHRFYNYMYGYRCIISFVLSDTYGPKMAAICSRNMQLLLDFL